MRVIEGAISNVIGESEEHAAITARRDDGEAGQFKPGVAYIGSRFARSVNYTDQLYPGVRAGRRSDALHG